MICWQCCTEIELIYEAPDYSVKLFHCGICDRWFEMRKEKERVNSSVPVRFAELDSPPFIPGHLNTRGISA